MTDPASDDALVDVQALAEWQGVPASTVHGWIWRYGIQAQGKDGRRKLYAVSDLLDALDRARGETK